MNEFDSMYSLAKSVKGLQKLANDRKLTLEQNADVRQQIENFERILKSEVNSALFNFYTFVDNNRELYDGYFLSYNFLRHSKVGKIRACDRKQGIVVEMLTRYENETERSYVILPYLFFADKQEYKYERELKANANKKENLLKIEQSLQGELIHLQQRIKKVQNQIAEFNQC